MNLAETTVSNICIFKPEIGPKHNRTREQLTRGHKVCQTFSPQLISCQCRSAYMAEASSGQNAAAYAVPKIVSMKLFASWEIDKTSSSCIPRSASQPIISYILCVCYCTMMVFRSI